MHTITVLTIALLLGAMSLTAPAQTIELRAHQVITGSEILLGDIALDAGGLPQGWAARTVMKAPDSSAPAIYTLSTIARALQKYPDMHDVILRGAPGMTLVRAGDSLPAARITEAIEKFIRTSDEWKDAPLDITFRNPGPALQVPSGDVEVRVTDYARQSSPNNYTFKASVFVDGAHEHSLSVDAKVTPMHEVWVAAKPMARGHMVEPDDLERRMVVSNGSANLMPATEPVTGMEANRAVDAGQPLSRHFFVEPQCARRGELLNVSALRGTLSVMLRAKALSAGRRGERIMCVNERSNRRLMVRLTGDKEATLDVSEPDRAEG